MKLNDVLYMFEIKKCVVLIINYNKYITNYRACSIREFYDLRVDNFRN